jgi:bifunctional DNase/RNase
MPDMIEVVIDSVRVHLMTPQRVVVLKQTDSERYLPIWVGLYEAEAITVALQEVEMVRPLTHDLLKNVFGAFSAQIVRVEIVKLQEDIFYGSIVALVDRREVHVDSRPSDAIAIAVRAHVPILVNPAVMEAAGIVPEQDIPDGAPTDDKAGGGPMGEEGSERLSVFEDFVGKLDLDRLGGRPGDDQAGPPDEPRKPKGPDKPGGTKPASG